MQGEAEAVAEATVGTEEEEGAEGPEEPLFRLIVGKGNRGLRMGSKLGGPQ